MGVRQNQITVGNLIQLTIVDDGSVTVDYRENVDVVRDENIPNRVTFVPKQEAPKLYAVVEKVEPEEAEEDEGPEETKTKVATKPARTKVQKDTDES